MANKAVSNTGPFIHLTEIGLIKTLNSFKEIYIAGEVRNELIKSKIVIPKKIKLLNLLPTFKDTAEILVNKFSLDLGESQSIALALQEKTDYFLTDDLDARTVANLHHVESHGTVGIILRALREGIVDKETSIKKINELYEHSSLFITKDLINQAIKAINDFKK
ncbi:hypothetical protein HYS31_07260 [Candidatus Woesearchaeota archaeon]|nr:hypothetical protein [Candidatus Woesearchaeota archaeon]